MGTWVVLVRSDLRRRIRNRSALISAVLAPLALSFVFSALVGGSGADDTFRIGVAAARSSPATDAIMNSLVHAEAGPVQFRRVDDADAARSQVESDSLDAAIVLPAGFGAGPVADPVTVLRDPDRQLSGGIAASVADGLAQRSDRVNRIVATLVARGDAPSDEVIDRAASVESLLKVGDDRERGELSAAAYFGASMSIIFLFFTVGYVATSLHVERRTGTLDRILATPTWAPSVVTAKAASVGIIGVVGFAVVWLVTTLAGGAHWGHPIGVASLIVATTAAVSGVAILAVSLARTEQQSEAVTAMAAFTLAILGGNFIGPGAAPELLGRLAILTPNGWALRTFSDLSTGSASSRDVAVAVAVLAGFGLVGGGIGLFRLRRMVDR